MNGVMLVSHLRYQSACGLKILGRNKFSVTRPRLKMKYCLFRLAEQLISVRTSAEMEESWDAQLGLFEKTMGRFSSFKALIVDLPILLKG